LPSSLELFLLWGPVEEREFSNSSSSCALSVSNSFLNWKESILGA
jgi:hypothetical protein